MKRYTSAQEYFEAQEEWSAILNNIREIIKQSELEETVKWGAPAYTYKGKTLLGMAAFKNFVSVWFHQGALLKDEQKKLINAQEGKTQALRQWRISAEQDIDKSLLLAYIQETIDNHKQGKQIKPKKEKPLTIPDELKRLLDKHPLIASKFNEMGRSKQREFAEYISEAKRSETKISRLEKILPMILEGTGLNDKYK